MDAWVNSVLWRHHIGGSFFEVTAPGSRLPREGGMQSEVGIRVVMSFGLHVGGRQRERRNTDEIETVCSPGTVSGSPGRGGAQQRWSLIVYLTVTPQAYMVEEGCQHHDSPRDHLLAIVAPGHGCPV